MNYVGCVGYQDFLKIFFYVDKIIAFYSNKAQLVMYSHSPL